MDWLRVFGLALWIVSLSIQASASRAAFRRMAPGTPVPLGFGGVRAPRAVALGLIPAASFLIGAALMPLGREATGFSTEAWLFFGLRATGAALLALAHLRWLSTALATLAREGALKS
jgi:hypothetical protein